MSKKAYRVEGDFQMGRIRQHFAIEVVGKDEAAARERALSTVGGRHGVERRAIALASVMEIAAADADPITQKHLE